MLAYKFAGLHACSAVNDECHYTSRPRTYLIRLDLVERTARTLKIAKTKKTQRCAQHTRTHIKRTSLKDKKRQRFRGLHPIELI